MTGYRYLWVRGRRSSINLFCDARLRIRHPILVMSNIAAPASRKREPCERLSSLPHTAARRVARRKTSPEVGIDVREVPIAEVGGAGEPAARHASRDGIGLEGGREGRRIEPDHQAAGEEECCRGDAHGQGRAAVGIKVDRSPDLPCPDRRRLRPGPPRDIARNQDQRHECDNDDHQDPLVGDGCIQAGRDAGECQEDTVSALHVHNGLNVRTYTFSVTFLYASGSCY